MNIHDVALATKIAEKVLRQVAGLTPMQRMEICAAFQGALIDAELSESVAVGSSADSLRAAATDPQTARGFQLRAHTPAGDRFARDLDRALSAVLPHGGDTL